VDRERRQKARAPAPHSARRMPMVSTVEVSTARDPS
jgi:hypothetical protein